MSKKLVTLSVGVSGIADDPRQVYDAFCAAMADACEAEALDYTTERYWFGAQAPSMPTARLFPGYGLDKQSPRPAPLDVGVAHTPAELICVASMGKSFKLRAVCTSVGAANKFTAANPGTAVFAAVGGVVLVADVKASEP